MCWWLNAWFFSCLWSGCRFNDGKRRRSTAAAFKLEARNPKFETNLNYQRLNSERAK
jgi:hypothetical protein